MNLIVDPYIYQVLEKVTHLYTNRPNFQSNFTRNWNIFLNFLLSDTIFWGTLPHFVKIFANLAHFFFLNGPIHIPKFVKKKGSLIYQWGWFCYHVCGTSYTHFCTKYTPGVVDLSKRKITCLDQTGSPWRNFPFDNSQKPFSWVVKSTKALLPGKNVPVQCFDIIRSRKKSFFTHWKSP